MKISKSEEDLFRKRVALVTEFLKGMGEDDSYEFVDKTANPNTLRALRSLQNEIIRWGFDRS